MYYLKGIDINSERDGVQIKSSEQLRQDLMVNNRIR